MTNFTTFKERARLKRVHIPGTMRHTLFFFALFFSFTSCITPKRVDEMKSGYNAIILEQERDLRGRQDSISRMVVEMARLDGANEALLLTQDKMQDRLAVYEDELDKLRGNLNSTSTQMTAQLADTRKDLKMAELAYDTLLIDQQQIINKFQRGVKRADSVITNALEANISDGSYFVTVNAGEVVLSVQENALFKPKSVDQLNGDEAALILRAVMDALQSDPLLKLTIVGHTDNQPNPRRNTSNWNYAALRATFLADELATTYYLSPNRVVAASHGEFGPAKSNATTEGQRANRRVDFVLRNNVGNLLRELGRLEK